MAKMQRNTLLVILSFFAIYFIWGSTYLWNKIAVTELPAFMLAGIRFVTAGSLIFIISKFLGLPLKISKQEFKNTFIAGFLFLTFQLVKLAQREICFLILVSSFFDDLIKRRNLNIMSFEKISSFIMV